MQIRDCSRHRAWAVVLLAACGLAGACHSPTEPPPACFVEPPSGAPQAALYRVTGSGTCDSGATAIAVRPNGGIFTGTMKFRVKGAKPNTLYYVQRAAEFPITASSADGVCQRANGAPPWTAADGFTSATWLTFPLPFSDQGPLNTLTTDAAGDASVDFEFSSPQIAAGTKFDVTMRLVDANVGDSAGVTSELRSGCMTVLPL
jgi:hypothetical protein